MFEVAGIEAGYGEAQVLFGIDFHVNAGEAIAMLGRNGMGKTTTVRTIFGLLAARAGRVRCPCTVRASLPCRVLLPISRRGSRLRVTTSAASGSRPCWKSPGSRPCAWPPLLLLDPDALHDDRLSWRLAVDRHRANRPNDFHAGNHPTECRGVANLAIPITQLVSSTVP